MADKHSEPQILMSTTSAQIIEKGIESSSDPAPIEHFSSIPARMHRSDGRLPPFVQHTELALQRSETRPARPWTK